MDNQFELPERDEAVEFLLSLADTEILREEVVAALEQIAIIIRAEDCGLMLWGCSNDVREVFNVVAADRCTMDMRTRFSAVYDAYGYEVGGGAR